LCSFFIGSRLVFHWSERVVDVSFGIIDWNLVIVDDVVENSFRGLSHSLWVRARLWLLDHGSRDVFIIFPCLRKFPFFNASVTELVDEVVDIKLIRMILFLLLR
jgi:hypothetical protein